MNKKFLLALPLVLLMVVSVSGVAYAMWCDSVVFAGEVNTATFCAEITDVSVSDEFGDLDIMADPENCNNWTPVRLDKDVGYSYAEWGGPVPPDTVYFYMTNTYPGYVVTLGVDIRNCGTIPWNTTAFEFYYDNGTYIRTLYTAENFGIDFNDDGLYDIKISWNEDTSNQRHFGQAVEMSWNIKVLEWAPQDDEFGFYIVIKVCAFNAIPENGEPNLPPFLVDN